MSKSKSHNSKIKNTLIISGVLIVLGIGVYLLIRDYNHSRQVITPPGGVKLAPATDQEKQESDQNKARIAQEQQNSQNQTSGKKQVIVTITQANSSSVNAYVTGVFEDNGTCTATFTQNTTVVTRTSSGFGNVSYTQCSPITPNLPSGGSWSVTVTYTSADAEGVSQAQSF